MLFYNKEKLTDSLFLPIKLIATESSELTNLVIKATNWQTEVKQEAFIALEPFQKRLEEFYASILVPNQKLYYERRSKQYEADDTPKFRVVSLTTQTKCFVAMYLEAPQSTHRYYGELLNANRKLIFQDDHDPQPYYCCAYANFLIEREFRVGRVPYSLKPYRYHFLFLLRLFVAPNEIISLQLGAKKTKEFSQRLLELLNDPVAFQEALQKAKRTIDAVLARSGTKYEGEAERRSDFTTAIRAEFLDSCGLRTGQHPAKRALQPSGHKLDHARVRGVIKRAGPEFGFIRDENGQDVFFHRSQWKGPEVILDGTPVSFLVTMGQKGLRALAVQIERSSAAAVTQAAVRKAE